MRNPVFDPFDNIFLRRRDEITRLVGVSTAALRGTNGIERLATVLKHSDEDVKRSRDLEQAAKAQLEAELPLLHSAATVLIWGALEVAVRDFLVRWLGQYPLSRQAEEFKKIKISVVDYEALESEDRMRFLLREIEQGFKTPPKTPGFAQFICLLNALKIFPEFSDQDKKLLNEFAAVRNVIAHKAGQVDERFLALCPWTPYLAGQHIQINFAQFCEYVRVASEFCASIIEAAEVEIGKRVQDPRSEG